MMKLKLAPEQSTRAIVIFVLVTAVLTALDLGSKNWAQATLSRERVGTIPEVCDKDEQGFVLPQRIRSHAYVLIDGYLEFRYAENCAAAFSMLSSTPLLFRRILFTSAAIIAVLVLTWMFLMRRGGPWFYWSVPFVISGALGNLIDRMRLGYVIDFIRFHIGATFEWPTFNVADITITIGVIMMIIDSFRQPSAAKHAAAAASKKVS